MTDFFCVKLDNMKVSAHVEFELDDGYLDNDFLNGFYRMSDG